MTKIELPSPYECNVCKKRRDGDVNHWFVLQRCVWAGATQADCIEISRWGESQAQKGEAHACGQEDAQILIARWMSHGNFEEGK